MKGPAVFHYTRTTCICILVESINLLRVQQFNTLQSYYNTVIYDSLINLNKPLKDLRGDFRCVQGCPNLVSFTSVFSTAYTMYTVLKKLRFQVDDQTFNNKLYNLQPSSSERE